jgi:hypothetical protein
MSEGEGEAGPIDAGRLGPLPPRTARDEEAFVLALLDGGEHDPDDLIDLVSAAMDARRPRLAARVVQLLPDHVEIPAGSALERATRAARLLVLDASDIELYNALDEAWREVRRKRMKRMLERQRLAGRNEQFTVPRVGRRPRRR